MPKRNYTHAQALLPESKAGENESSIGRQLHRYENLLNKQLHADNPNRKWGTDISYIHTRQGNPHGNAMAENFFSILKTECIYRHKLKPFKEADDLIGRYIHFYNHGRIQTKTEVAPLTQRHSA